MIKQGRDLHDVDLSRSAVREELRILAREHESGSIGSDSERGSFCTCDSEPRRDHSITHYADPQLEMLWKRLREEI